MPTLHPRSKPISQWPKVLVAFLLPQLSNGRILAVPDKAVLCNRPILMVTFSSDASNLMLYYSETVPKTTSTTSRYLNPHI